MLTKINFAPGVNKNVRQTSAEGYWYDADKVRFIDGMPQRIGAWQQVGSLQVTGMARSMIGWTTLAGFVTVAIGTHSKLYVYQGGALYNITPYRATAALVNAFTTVNLDNTVTVTDTAHGAAVGDTVNFTAVTVGGLAMGGDWVITEIVDADNFRFEHTSAATSSTGPTGNTTASYEISPGYATGSYGVGYGAGPYGMGTYGTPRSSSSIILQPRIWSLDLWGEDLVATYNGGAVYRWDASTGTATHAALISAAPSTNNLLAVTQQRFLVTYGTYDTVTSAFDPLLIRWSSQEDYDTWTPAETNTSGQYRLNNGTRIVARISARGSYLVLTDTDVWSQQFIDSADVVYSFENVMPNAGAVAPNAIAAHEGVVYWMGNGDFYRFDGTISAIKCPISEHVFDNINRLQKNKSFAFTNKLNDEVWFFYADNTSDEPNKYVIYNVRDGSWTNGSMDRTCWVDMVPTQNPMAIDSDGYIYLHEIEDPSAGEDFDAYLDGGYFDLGDGDKFFFVDRVVPDFDLGDSVTMTLSAKRYFHSTTTTSKGPYTVEQDTEKFDTRLRGRIMKIRIDSSGKNATWQLSALRLNVQPDGGR